MRDDDLIRRGDAIKAVDDWQGDWSCTVLALSALPAVQPDLTDPNVVHANMLRGTIARPTVDQIRNIYGSELTALHALAPDWPTQIDDILSNFAGRQRCLGAEFERALAEDIEKLYEGGPVQPDAAAIREAALLDVTCDCGKSRPCQPASECRWPVKAHSAGAGAAGPFHASPRDWTEDFAHENGSYMYRCFTCGSQFFGYKRRVTCRVCAQPEPVAGAAPRRASGPIDPEAGFATSGAEARWIGDFDAGVYDDAPEEIGILQARVEDQDREWADLMRQLQGQPRRQSDVNAGGHPTESQIASVCLSYRHDFGLLSEHQRELIMFEGLEWLRAWRREFSSLPKPVAGAAQDGAAEREIDALRLKAFRTNAPSDREAYFMATSKWFQDRHYRYMAARKGDSHE